jgi:hypothetical protein
MKVQKNAACGQGLTWRSRRLSSTTRPAQPRLIRLSVSDITFNYSAENGLGPTDLVNKYVKIVNQWGIVSQIFVKINLYIMILKKISVICTLY